MLASTSGSLTAMPRVRLLPTISLLLLLAPPPVDFSSNAKSIKNFLIFLIIIVQMTRSPAAPAEPAA